MGAHDRTAILFPGQGSATRRMRDLVEQRRPDLVELAIEVVDEDPFARVGEGTRFDQPAIYCASLAGLAELGEPRPEFFAGHSMGEIAALVAAGALGEREGLAVVAERGRLMDAAARNAGGGMLAVRLSRAQADEFAESAGLVVANDNAPDQVVLSGPEDALVAAEGQARGRRLRTKRLAVAGAFHSPTMAAAVEPFRTFLADVDFARPEVPVFSGVTAEPFGDPRRLLAEALIRPVRWLEVMRRLRASGVRRFVEPGPGRVLAGLVRRTLEGVETTSLATREPARA